MRDRYVRDGLSYWGVPPSSTLQYWLDPLEDAPLVALWNASAGCYHRISVQPSRLIYGGSRWLDTLSAHLRTVAAMHALEVYAKYPLWWEGEAVVDL